jgi:hypothetical protein
MSSVQPDNCSSYYFALPKQIATKNSGGCHRRSVTFLAQGFKFRALSGENRRKPLSMRHFLLPAFYSAVSQNTLAAGL